jgi:hypothetical protein
MLRPIFLTDLGSKLKVTRVTPIQSRLVQFVGHERGKEGVSLFSGFGLKTGKNIPIEDAGIGALLRSEFVLDTSFNADLSFKILSASMSRRSVHVSKAVPEVAAKIWEVSGGSVRHFERFYAQGGIFIGRSVVLLGLEGMTSCLKVLSDDLSGDEKIIAKQTKFGDLSITGFDQLHRWNTDHFLVVATAFSAAKQSTKEEQSTKEVWTLLRFDMKGRVTAASSPEFGPFSVFPSDGGVYLARRRRGASGEFQIIVEDLDADFNVRKETVIPSEKLFPAQFELVSSGNRPAIAVLGLNLIEIFDCTTGHSIFKFTPEYRVSKLLGFHYIEGIPMLFVTVEDPVDNVRRGAFFQLPAL